MGLGGIEFYRVLSSFTEFYRVLQGFQKGSPNKVPSFTVWLLGKKNEKKTWTERKKPPTARKAPLAPFDCTEFSGVF